MNIPFFAQLASPPTGAIENWLLSAAAIASMALLAKKLFASKRPGECQFVTKTEFHQELGTLRDKIDARFLTLVEKLDETKGELLTAAEHRATATDRRLTNIESTLARLDERTKREH